jgi:hypothetical protein
MIKGKKHPYEKDAMNAMGRIWKTTGKNGYGPS